MYDVIERNHERDVAAAGVPVAPACEGSVEVLAGVGESNNWSTTKDATQEPPHEMRERKAPWLTRTYDQLFVRQTEGVNMRKQNRTG